MAISYPPNSRQELLGSLRRRAPREGRGQHVPLAAEAGIVETGAAADAIRERQTGQAVHEERRRGGIADTHLAQNQRVAAPRGDLIDHLGSALERCPAFPRGHRGLDREVARAAADLGADEPRVRTAIAVDAGVHDPQLHALKPREHVDGGAAAQEILDHLLGDRARIGADAAVRHAVIARRKPPRPGWISRA